MAKTEPIPAWKKYVAEFLGTFTLLFAGLGAGVFLSYTDSGNSVNAGFIALAVGGSIAWGVYAWGNISGGHYNPGVTVAFAAAGRMNMWDVIPYWIAQLMGGITGLGVVYGIASGYPAPTHATSIAVATAMASNGYAGNSSPYLFGAGSVLLREIAASFLFYVVILFVTDKQAWKGFHGLAIGGVLSVLVLVGMTVDGAGYNPARSTASALWATAAGVGGWPMIQLWAFWVGPFIGAILAAVVWRAINTEPTEPPAVETKPAAARSSDSEKR